MYTKKSHIHFVGIGGIGMSGIATILRQQGYEISGCDADIHQQSVQNLINLGCHVYEGNNTESCRTAPIDVLVYSSAIRTGHPEIAAAQARGIPTIPRALMLAELMRTKYSIAIAGSHGKTTTTSLISHILIEAGLDPTVIIGGMLKNISNNARMGTGNFLVAEADESDRSFLQLYATFAVVTNIDLEHLDTYQDLDDIKQAFASFLNNIPFYGKAVVCIDDEHVRSMLPLPQIRCIRYGIEQLDQADIYAREISLDKNSSSCTVYKRGAANPLGRVTIAMPGKHNVLNALAAIAISLELSIPFTSIQKALASFAGVERRFTYRGTHHGITIFDDYGHHPREIEATLTVARACADNRLVVIFQPHRYTRTKALWSDFVTLFATQPIEQLLITDIYSASEQPLEGITAESLVAAIHEQNPQLKLVYCPIEKLYEQTSQALQPGDLVLCIGAGKQVSELSKRLAE